MRQHFSCITMSLATLTLLAGGCAADGGDGPGTGTVEGAIVAGAAYTTFDVVRGGCKNSTNGVNCNQYANKQDVYINGGPAKAGLSDGSYYFSVLVPGSQNGGFVDGSKGNLSDTKKYMSEGDKGLGDSWTNRAFTVTGTEISSYTGTHAIGTSPQGRKVIALFPYDNTSNLGGVYILAICQVGATSPSQCKYDAFKVAKGKIVPLGTVGGGKYYDANANGAWDVGEAGIGGWQINVTDSYGILQSIDTSADGSFLVAPTADTYSFAEAQSVGWFQTGNLVNQTVVANGSSATLANFAYNVTVVDGSTTSGINFGNLCIGATGGHTLGFWSNPNGEELFGADDLAYMVSLNLVNGAGSAFDPANYAAFNVWILDANGVSMAYMLSAQMAAAALNTTNSSAVHSLGLSSSNPVLAPGANCAAANGFCTLGALIAEANASLAANPYTPTGHPARDYQTALKNALDASNNNKNNAHASAASCAAPIFP